MEALRCLLALAWPLMMVIMTQVAFAEGHPPPPPTRGGNFSTTSQRQRQYAIDNDTTLLHYITFTKVTLRYSPYPAGLKSSCSGGVQAYPAK